MSETVKIEKEELQSLIDERVAAQLDEYKQRRSRRSVLASLAGAAGLGAMGYGWITDVQATDGSAVGQIGTPSDKVNVYAHSLGDPNNPVDEFYVEDEFVTDTQQSLTVDDLTVNQSASIEELSNTEEWPADENTDVAALIDDIKADRGRGRIRLKPGHVYQQSQIGIPGGIEVVGPGQNTPATIQPQNDNDVFIFEGGAGSVRNVRVDVTSVGAYSSAVCKFSGDYTYQDRHQFTEGLTVIGSPGSTDGGAAFRYEATKDDSTAGNITWTHNQALVVGLQHAVDLDARDNSGEYINSNSFDIHCQQTYQPIIERTSGTGVVAGNQYQAEVEGSSDTDQVFFIDGERTTIDLHVTDTGLFASRVGFFGSNSSLNRVRLPVGGAGWFEFSDDGAANIVGQIGYTLSASPGSGSSQWDGTGPNGNDLERYAAKWDVTIEDRSASQPYPLFEADSGQNYVQIG